MDPLIAVVGDLVEDVVVKHTGAVVHGADTPASISRRRGGSAANVAVALARLGTPARFIGCVGDDPAGRALTELLAREGVDVRVQRRGVSGAIVVLVDADGERSMLPDRGACTALDDVPDEWLAGLHRLHVPAYSLHGEPLAATTERLAAQVRNSGGEVSVDASSVTVLHALGVAAFLDWIERIGADVLFANEQEAEVLALADTPARGALTRTVVVVKRGARPVLVHLPHSPEPLEVLVPRLRHVTNTTGAGDGFAAGFLTEWMQRDGAVALHGTDPVRTATVAALATLAGVAAAQRAIDTR